ncbi:hypothetical protein ACX0G9_27500 [Flavitalea flava]
MNPANLQLSPEELALISDSSWILTKNATMARIIAFFADLSEEMKSLWPHTTNPKISKGENYNGLPYVVLDYPRLFGREDVLAVRTLFWWGHYFSVTLHLKGRFQESLLPVIKENLKKLSELGFHISISDDEWKHEIEADHYTPIEEINESDLEGRMTNHPFLKLSAKCPLEAGNIHEKLMELFGALTVLAT